MRRRTVAGPKREGLLRLPLAPAAGNGAAAALWPELTSQLALRGRDVSREWADQDYSLDKLRWPLHCRLRRHWAMTNSLAGGLR